MSRFVFCLAISALLVAGVGCGGISASHSVSPIDFFLPGLLQNKPADSDIGKTVSHPATNADQTAAQSL